MFLWKLFCSSFDQVVHPCILSEERQCAFESAKSLLCRAPVLAAPDFSHPFKLDVDASTTRAGAMLLQDGGVPPCLLFLSEV